MIRRRPCSVLAAALALTSLAGCSLFTLKEPYPRWRASVLYRSRDGRVVALPATVEVNGPRGEIVLTNFTFVERGFVIPDLAIFERVGANGATRIDIDGAEDGATYRFRDDLDSDGPGGIIVVRYGRRRGT